MYVPKGYAQVYKTWLGRIINEASNKDKAPKLINDMEEVLWGLWMGRLDQDAMEFYRWLDSKLGEVKQLCAQ